MKIVKVKIELSELNDMAAAMFGDMVKAVVDINKEIMAIDAELHSDEEALLLKEGSKQDDIWGINIYPELPPEERVEFDSMINLRPRVGNRTRGVDNTEIRSKIISIVNELIE